VNRVKGEIFELSPYVKEKEGEEIMALLGRCAVVVDEKFIPHEARYVVLRPYPFTTKEGYQRMATVGLEVTLNQEEACQKMVDRYVKPVDPSAWTPAKLLGTTVDEGRVKRMFDDLPAEKEKGWLFKGRER